MAPQQLIEQSSLELSVADRIISGEFVDIDFANDFLKALLIVARPFDFDHQPLTCIPLSCQLNDQISAAFWLMASKPAQEFFNNERLDELDEIHIFDNQNLVLDFEEIFTSKIAGPWFESEKDNTLPHAPDRLLLEDNAFVAKVVAKAQKTASSSARFLVRSGHVVRQLGISADEVDALFYNSGARVVKASGRGGVKLFDFGDLIGRIRCRIDDQPPRDAIEIAPNDERLASNLDNYGNFIGHVISGRYEGCFSLTDGLRSVFVDRNKFAQYEWHHFQTATAKGAVEFSRAAKCLGISVSEIETLISKGELAIKGRPECRVVSAAGLKKLKLKQITREKSERARQRTSFVSFATSSGDLAA